MSGLDLGSVMMSNRHSSVKISIYSSTLCREVILGGTGGYRGYATFGPQIPLKMFAPSGVGKTNAIEAMIFFISTSSYSANEHAKLR